MGIFIGQSETVVQCDGKHCQLLTRLCTYIKLYSRERTYFKYIAVFFCKSYSRTQNRIEAFGHNKAAKSDALFMAGYGGRVGLLTGGVVGIISSVAASAALLGDNLSAVSASVSCLGGVLGSISGATFASGLGGAAWKAAESTGYSVSNKGYRLSWCAIGGATGATVGHVFGGKVGAVAGVVGGALGALCGVTASFQCKHIHLEQNFSCDAFRRITSPLIAELSIINAISCQMDTGEGGMASQSSKCLNAISRTRDALANVEKEPQSVSCMHIATEDFQHMFEELETMQCEAEKLLASWNKPNVIFSWK